MGRVVQGAVSGCHACIGLAWDVDVQDALRGAGYGVMQGTTEVGK